MTYFRVKKARLGPAYERFLRERVVRDGTIYLVECGLQWPTTTIQDRHYFQFGALGGATVEEFQHGSPRVEEYLQRYGSRRKRWALPTTDAVRPEAEWGFEAELRADVERVAHQLGLRVQRIVFDEPEDLSPLVADFYREWHEARGVRGNRLLVESFILMDPYWAVRAGCVPYWMVFNKEPSADNLERFLSEREPFDEMGMMVFSHGVNSIGLVPIERWRALLGRARSRGEFLGVDEGAYPRDFNVFARYRDAIMSVFTSRYPLPPPVDLARFEEFVGAGRFRYGVRLSDMPQAQDRTSAGS